MIRFTKMCASGNDFIVIDNREGQISDVSSQMSDFVRKVCQRKLGVGADGVLLIEDSSEVDFKMRIFNPDGGEVEMCGNGARCVALYESIVNSQKTKVKNQNTKVKIETKAGVLEAEVISDDKVRLKMGDPLSTRLKLRLSIDNREYEVHSINTGVPHVILFVEDLGAVRVKDLGEKIRYDRKFAPEGTNVDFIKVRDEHSLDIRTYERGVEDETLACGTGAVAGAIVSHLLERTESPTRMHTRSGSILKVYFDSVDFKISNLYLEGDAEVIYEGEIV